MAGIDNTRLALVCTRWRDVVNATRRLFRRITLRYERNELVSRNDYLRQYLKMSGENQLEVVIPLVQSYSFFDGPPPDVGVTRANRRGCGDSQLEQSVLARCFSLKIVRFASFSRPTEFMQLSGSYPLLKHLDITVNHFPGVRGQEEFAPLCGVKDCANLETITISGPYYYDGFSFSLEGPGRFDRVTRVSIHNGQDAVSVANLLRSVPNLLFLSWYDEGLTGPDFDHNFSPSGCTPSFQHYPENWAHSRNDERYNFPLLQELRLSGGVPIMTLRHIEAPSLQSTALFAYRSELHSSTKLDKDAANLVVDRLTEPDGWPLLTKLELCNQEDSDLLASVLSFQENLEEFTVHHAPEQSPGALWVIGGRVDDAADDVCCPRLKRLIIKNTGDVHSEQIDVLMEIAARRKDKIPDIALTIEVHTLHEELIKDPLGEPMWPPGTRVVRKIQCLSYFSCCDLAALLVTDPSRLVDVKPDKYGFQGVA